MTTIRTALATPPERGARRSLYARLRMSLEEVRTIKTIHETPQRLARRLGK